MRNGLRVSLIFLLLLSGCLTQNTQEEQNEQKINIFSNQNWTIRSKISFSNSEEQGFATLKWRQRKDNHYIDLKFPLNASYENRYAWTKKLAHIKNTFMGILDSDKN